MEDSPVVIEAKNSIDYLIAGVASRGWRDAEQETDDFSTLRTDRRFRDAQVAGLYEQYFQPERHEFEWQALSDIVNAVVSSPAVTFAGLAVAGGVIGNAAYDLLKNLCRYSASQFGERLGSRFVERAQAFEKIAKDADTLRSFFLKNTRANIARIEEATGLSREAIYPLMKIAGMRHYRKGPLFCNWERPE